MSEQEKRKSKSQNLLKILGSYFLPSLPVIESEDETSIRTTTEIGARIICLVCVAAAADGMNKEDLISWLKQEALYSALSSNEIKFLEMNESSKNEITHFSWQSECIWLLLWATKKVERNLPTEQCDTPKILEVIPEFGSSTLNFMNSLNPRPKSEILDMSDLLYRAHWATRQAGLNEQLNIGKLNPDVVMEWHLAVNWLTCYEEIEDWDEITTDT